MNPEVKKNLFLFVYYLIGALIIIGLLFFAFHSAHAEAAYYFQSDKSGTFTYSGSGSRFTVNIPGLGSSSSTHVYVMMWFKGTNTVKEEAGADTLDCNVDPNICLYSYSANGVYDSPTIFVNPSSTVWNTTGTTEGIFSAWYNIGRGNVWTLSTSTPVIFTRSTAVGTGNDTQTFYTGGDWSFTAYGNAAGTLPYLCVADSYANVIANCNPFAPPPPTPPTLSITYPVSGSLYQYAPSQILLTASPFTSVGDTVKIFYGVFGAGVQYTDVYPIQNDTTSSDWIFPIQHSLNILNNPSSTVEWTFSAEWDSATGTVIASTTLPNIHFDVIQQTSSTILFPIGIPHGVDSSTMQTQLDNCDAMWANTSTLQNVICKIQNKFVSLWTDTLNLIFGPATTSSQQSLEASYQTFQTKFPFSLVYSVVGALQSSVGSSTNLQNQTLTLTIPQLNISATLLSPTTLEDAVGSTTKNIFFTWTKTLIWSAAAFKALLITSII